MENRIKNEQEIQQQMQELNDQFAAFLRTKGIKAKYMLVIENIKKGIAEAPANTAAQIARTKAQTQTAVAHANAFGKPGEAAPEVNASSLEDEFNAFLKSQGLDGKYTVTVTEE